MIDVHAHLSANRTVQRKHTCFVWLAGKSYEMFRPYEPRLSQRRCMINPKQRSGKSEPAEMFELLLVFLCNTASNDLHQQAPYLKRWALLIALLSTDASTTCVKELPKLLTHSCAAQVPGVSSGS